MKFGGRSNGKDYEVSESRRQALENIMEVLRDPSIYMIGVCGKDDDNHITYEKNHLTSLLERVIRRGLRDNLFDEIVKVSIGENPDLRRIQHEIAREIGCIFQEQEEKQDKGAACYGSHYFQFHNIDNNIKTTVTENAQQLSDEIRTVSKILFILHDLRSRFDLAEVGIPFGVDHQGLKLILTSESEDILFNQMNTHQCTFML